MAAAALLTRRRSSQPLPNLHNSSHSTRARSDLASAERPGQAPPDASQPAGSGVARQTLLGLLQPGAPHRPRRRAPLD